MNRRATNKLRVGVLGGGQLGMLLARALPPVCHIVGYQESTGSHPATPYFHEIIEGRGWGDASALERFFSACDVVLFENEFVPLELLAKLAEGKDLLLVPDLASYGVFQHKIREKEAAQRAGIPVAPWTAVASLQEVEDFRRFHQRLVLKTARGGYDGYGNLVVDASTSPAKIQEFLSRGECLAEAFVNFQGELAVVVTRSAEGVFFFPIAETLQENNICHFVLAPARISQALAQKIFGAATQLLESIDARGVFGIEFFYGEGDEIFYNESAPRPHNSAHFTLDGCDQSQFELIARLAQGLPLSAPVLTTPVVGMLNLLGTQNGPAQLRPKERFTALEDGKLWEYGKEHSRIGRKMGHFNLRGRDHASVLAQLQTLKQGYSL